MARQTLKLNLWRMTAVGTSLAAAAAILIAVVLNWPGAGAVSPVTPPPGSNLQLISTESVVNVIEDKVVHVDGNLPPVHQITRETFEKKTWVDKLNNVHIETTSAPRREIILIQQKVE